jgi:hypothetical protein
MFIAALFIKPKGGSNLSVHRQMNRFLKCGIYIYIHIWIRIQPQKRKQILTHEDTHRKREQAAVV